MMRRTIRYFCAVSVPTAASAEVAVVAAGQLDGSLVRRRKQVMAWYSAPGYDLRAAQQQIVLNSPGLSCIQQKEGSSSSAKDAAPPTTPEEKAQRKIAEELSAELHTFPEQQPTATCKGTELKAKNKLQGTVQIIGGASGGSGSSNTGAGRAPLSGEAKPPDVLCITPPIAGATGGRPTFVVFADGGMVGWDATWGEMLALREFLSPVVQTSSFLANANKSPAAEASSRGQRRGMIKLQRDASKTNLLRQVAERHTILESLAYETYDEYRNEQLVGGGNVEGGNTSQQLHRSEEFVVEVPEDERNFVDSSTDTIVLNSDEDFRSKVAFSYALSQSVKLDAIDHAVYPISSELKRWQTTLASTGRVLCSLTTLRKSKTRTMSLLENLNFKQHIDTSPKIFWSGDYQHLRSVYKAACSHLEIGERGSALKTKLDTIDDSVTYLHHEVHASSNEFLTWVIIVLIALELLQAMGMFADFEERVFGKAHSASRGWFKDRSPPESDPRGADGAAVQGTETPTSNAEVQTKAATAT